MRSFSVYNFMIMMMKLIHTFWSGSFKTIGGLGAATVIYSLLSCTYFVKQNNAEDSTSIAVSADLAADNSTLPEAKISAGKVQGRDSGMTPVIQETSSDIVNVKSFGAKGDGKSDDVMAINKALATGKSVYFPAGEYIIASGPLVIRNIKNIRIYGDGNRTWLHPPGQLEITSKVVFYSTFSIDNCDHITIENMRIESKGENWGDADAGHKQASGDDRSNWIIEKGGHALVITRSTNINVKKIAGRFCGSTGVFYASSSDNVFFINCFANAASLGYAGFAADNFADTRVTFLPKRRYYFSNCSVWAEPQLYPGKKFSSKGAIVTEGDNARVLNIYINGGTFKDCATGGDVKNAGAAVSAENSNLSCKNITAVNNYIGVRIRNRSDIEQGVDALIENCNFSDNSLCGFYIASAYKGTGIVNIVKSTFTQKPKSVWGFTKDPVLGQSSGIIMEGYMSQQKILIDSSSFSGGERYLFASDRITLTAVNSQFIKSTKSSFEIFGGGAVDFENCEIDLVSQGTIASHNFSKKYSTPISLNFSKNNVRGLGNSKNYWNVNSNIGIKNTIVVQQNPDNATLLSKRSVEDVSSKITGIVDSYGLQGKNTSVIIILDDNRSISSAPKQIFNTDNKSFNVLQVVPNWNNNPQKVKIFLGDDVRRFFTPKSKIVLK